MDPFIGEIKLIGFPYAPRGWALCNGQLLSIAQNTALFSLIGTYFGGNGQTTFGLPDLRGRVPVHSGLSQGPGLSNYDLGQAAGSENVTLTTLQMPQHIHMATMSADASPGTTINPANAHLAQVNNPNGDAPFESFTTNASNPVQLAGSSPSTPAGGSQPHSNIQPYLAVNFIIALEGVFPSRS